jgi:hypothetical protein
VFSLAPQGSVGYLSYPSQAHSGMICVRSDRSVYLEISVSKERHLSYVTFEVLTAVFLEIHVFWDNTPHQLLKSYRCFKGSLQLQPQGKACVLLKCTIHPTNSYLRGITQSQNIIKLISEIPRYEQNHDHTRNSRKLCTP